MTIHRTLFALVLAATTATAAGAQQQQPPQPLPINQDPRQVAQRLDEHMRRLVPFGYSGSLLVAKDGQIVLANGYGLADRENRVPVTAETVFDIGSITKQFTAAAILRLEMEGKLSVNDPVSRWFDGVPADKQGMTLHHLLTHSSGLRDGFGGDYEVAERDSLARVILTSELQWAPGTRYAYSNAGYSLLGAVVEKASGMEYERYLREKLWAPAGMTRTGYRGVQWRPGELAVGYREGARWGSPVDHLWAPDGPYWNLRANGGVLSTVTDLFRWHQALEGDAILSAAAKQKLWAPHVLQEEGGRAHYGYGWTIMPTVRETKLVSHNGGNGIFFADFRRYVDEGVVILVMSNSTEAPAASTLSAVARTVFGGEVIAPPVATDGDPARAAALAGTWTTPQGARLAVTADGGRLSARAENAAAFTLLGGAPSTPELEAHGQRAVEIISAAEAGNFVPWQQAWDVEATVEQLRGIYEDYMSEVRGRLGTLRGITHAGTTARGPAANSLVRLTFDGGSQLLRVFWQDGQMVGLRPAREPAPTIFVPVEANAWASYDIATGAGTRVRMESGALVIETPAGSVRATKSQG